MRYNQEVKAITHGPTLLIGLGLLLMQTFVLWLYGQPWLCRCGVVKFWEGDVWSAGMSQQLFDWYTFSHIIHGILFYGLLRLLLPRLSVARRLLIALGIEVGWELIENSTWIIHLYREQALAAGYTGDSILNSLSDSFSMVTGFVLAWRLPVWVTVAAVICLELFTAYMIHDNLTLNILNFIHPFDIVHQWQLSAPHW